ncbi:MAG: hypothetical protein ABJG68_15230 [Crocinitomicaceae bacterium]
MIIRSKAPFRIGLAGGGSDVSPYSDIYGGAVLNTAISLYAKTTIIPTDDQQITFESIDKHFKFQFESTTTLPLKEEVILQIGVYNHFVKHYTKQPLAFKMITEMDVPTGSGLGTSSTLVVSIIGAFCEWLNISLSPKEIAQKAFEIEREELGMAGGKQDQYAAALGGFNFLLFENQVKDEPLTVSHELINELEFNLILYYNKVKRESAKIIEAQMRNVKEKKTPSIEATHLVKKEAFFMKDELLAGRSSEIGAILNRSWENKKRMADGITNADIDKAYEAAMQAGALGGKISGAGGGGFMLFYTESENRSEVTDALTNLGGEIIHFQFVSQGLESWTIK